VRAVHQIITPRGPIYVAIRVHPETGCGEQVRLRMQWSRQRRVVQWEGEWRALADPIQPGASAPAAARAPAAPADDYVFTTAQSHLLNQAKDLGIPAVVLGRDCSPEELGYGELYAHGAPIPELFVVHLGFGRQVSARWEVDNRYPSTAVCVREVMWRSPERAVR
jgi:hypothetical protein